MKYLIIGAGISGLAAARLLMSRGELFEILDDRLKTLPDDLQGYKLWNEPISQPDFGAVVASPGLPQFHHGLEMARKYRIPIISEIDLALRDYRGKVLAITGTNGKSTTTAMCYHLLQKLGYPSVMGGNIGIPLCEMARQGLPEYLVLEISSYQAEQSYLIRPSVVIFTNFSPDHLERHGTVEEYFRAKMCLVRDTPQDGVLVTEKPVLELMNHLGFKLPKTRLILEDLSEEEVARISFLKEPHNLKNARQACLGVQAFLQGTNKPQSFSSIIAHLQSFTGLAHRCEYLGTFKGARVFNDSKSTNVDSTTTALRAYEGKILLLLGGRPKLESMMPILEFREKISQLLTFGEASEKVLHELSELSPIKISHIDQLPNFFKNHPSQADVILFSPGCASFDQFKNFEDRGNKFKIIMKKLLD